MYSSLDAHFFSEHGENLSSGRSCKTGALAEEEEVACESTDRLRGAGRVGKGDSVGIGGVHL